MKIGLLTVYYANFGSYYQAASLAKQLEALGHECEIVNASIRRKYAMKFLAGALGEKVLPKVVVDAIAKRVPAFRIYQTLKDDIDGLPISPKIFTEEALSKRYDCIIVGSDELWSATSPVMYFIPAYFGIGVTCPHISYATSASTLCDPDAQLEKKMAEGISSFRALSVRDPETQRWVKKWTGKTVPLVLDPTLLYPYFQDQGTGGQGILVYGEHFAASHVRLIQNYARQHKMQLHAICWKHDWCDSFIEVQSAAHLQQCFSEADFCVVSTFHGTVFSILHQRPFASFAAPGRKNKVSRLLEVLELSDCFWPEDCTAPVCFKADYESAYERLAVLRQNSLQYLVDALKQV